MCAALRQYATNQTRSFDKYDHHRCSSFAQTGGQFENGLQMAWTFLSLVPVHWRPRRNDFLSQSQWFLASMDQRPNMQRQTLCIALESLWNCSNWLASSRTTIPISTTGRQNDAVAGHVYRNADTLAVNCANQSALRRQIFDPERGRGCHRMISAFLTKPKEWKLSQSPCSVTNENFANSP